MSKTYSNKDNGKKKYYSMCTICNVHLHTPRDITDHYGGQLHVSMMAVVRTQLSFTEQFKTLDEKLKAAGKKESVIGLEYICEYAEDSHGVRMYECTLCERVLKDDSIFCHVTGIRHRILYLSKHHPIMGIDRKFQVKYPVDHRKLQNNAFAIEQTHKKKDIKSVNAVYDPKKRKVEFESYTEDVSPPDEELESMASLYEDKNAARRRIASAQPSHEGSARPKFQHDEQYDDRRDGGDARYQHGREGGSSYPYGSEKDVAYPQQYGSQYPYDNGRQYPQDGGADQRGGPSAPWGGHGGYSQHPQGDPRNWEDANYYHGRGSMQEDLGDVDIRAMTRGPPFPHDRRDYNDIDARAMSRQGDLDLRSKERTMGSGAHGDTGDLDVRSMMRAGGTSFRELKAAHEATLRKERYSHFYPEHNAGEEKDCDSDMEVRSMEFSDCDPEDFWCNEELFDFVRNYVIVEDQDMRFALRISQMFWNALGRHTQRRENLKKRILEEKIRLEEEKKAFLELKSKKESKSPPPSKKQKAAAAAKAGPPPLPDQAINQRPDPKSSLLQALTKEPAILLTQLPPVPTPQMDPRVSEVIRRNQPLLLRGTPVGDAKGIFNQGMPFPVNQINPQGPLIRLSQSLVTGGTVFGERVQQFPGAVRLHLGQWRGQVLP